MKKIIFIIVVLVIVVVAGAYYFFINKTPKVVVTNFEECVAAGNPVMESYPRQCRHGDTTYVEKIITVCAREQRNVDFCTTDYTPVCAKVNVQCIRAPCDPVNETFSNACEACKNSLVESYVAGECK